TALQLLGVDDGEVAARLHAVVEEYRIDDFAARSRQAEAHVADAEHGLAARQLRLDEAHRLDGLERAPRIGGVARGAGEDQRIEVEIFLGNTVLAGEQIAAANGDAELVLGADRLPLFVD